MWIPTRLVSPGLVRPRALSGDEADTAETQLASYVYLRQSTSDLTNDRRLDASTPDPSKLQIRNIVPRSPKKGTLEL
jgi:hypothetical protein